MNPRERPWRWRGAWARMPLVPPVIGLMAGIVFDSVAAAGAWVYAGGFAATGALLLWPTVRRRGLTPVVVALALCCGAVLHHNAYRRVAADHIVHRTVTDSATLARVRGTVLTAPRITQRAAGPFGPWMYSPDRTSFLFEADSALVEGRFVAVGGRMRVTVKEVVLDIQVGDRVELFGKLYRPLPPDNPGEFDWARWQRRHGVLVGISCNNLENVRHVEDVASMSLLRWVGAVRRRAQGLLLDEMVSFGEPEGTLVGAMVLAQRAGLDPKVHQAFVRTGASHYLAVSGFHVGMLALFVYWAGRAVGLAKRRSALLVVGATVFYAILAEPRPPIFRASVLAVVVCMSLIWRRGPNYFNWLALPALCHLIWRPTALFDVGFQLSYTCVVGILLLMPTIRSVLIRRVSVRRSAPTGEAAAELLVGTGRGRSWRRKVERVVQLPVAVALAAWLSSVPLLIFNFHQFSPWGWWNTLLIFPLVAIVMAAGFGTLLVGLISPYLASALTPAVEMPAEWLLWWVTRLGQVPGVMVYTTGPPAAWVLTWYAALASWVIVHRAHQRRSTAPAAASESTDCRGPQRRGVLAWVAAGAITAACGLVTAWWCWPGGADGKLTTTVLSVGRGTSVVIELPDGTAVLYDAGCSGSYDPGPTTIVPFLAHRGISRLDSAFISHPNIDHFGGLLSVADRVAIGSVVVGPQFDALSPANKPSRRLLEELRVRRLPVHLIDTAAGAFDLDGATFEVLWPPPEPPFDMTSNESSLVLRVTHHGQRILLTGDIDERAQGCLLQSGIDLTADVLLLPHHGGVQANTARFVAAVDPTYVIQSSSRPTPETRERLGAIIGRRTLYNTADDGAVGIVLGGADVEISRFRPVGRPPG